MEKLSGKHFICNADLVHFSYCSSNRFDHRRARRHQRGRRGGAARCRPGACAGHRGAAHGAGGRGHVLAVARGAGGGPGAGAELSHQEMGGGGRAGGQRFYLVISGAAPSAVRAFVMLAMVMVAMLLDRPALSMRSLGLAAAILLVLRPEAITEPGFQMSFAAVAGLVAVAEWEMRRERFKPRGPLLALCPWHRDDQPGGKPGDLAVRAVSFRPRHPLRRAGQSARHAGDGLLGDAGGGAVGGGDAASGWRGCALHLLGQGIDVMVAMGRWVSGLPGAVSLAPAMPLSALVLMALGGLWLAIWRKAGAGGAWRRCLLGVLAGAVAPLAGHAGGAAMR